jgi:hypothetical protein
MPYKYQWPMCAAGYGVLMAQRVVEQPTMLDIFVAHRLNKKTGAFEGYGITAGGFGEVKNLLSMPVGTISRAADEIWRELDEELQASLPFELEEFARQLFPLPGGSFMVRTPDENQVHAVNYFGLWVGDQTRRALLGAPGSDETKGVEVLRLNNTAGLAEQMARYPLFHAHEIRAFEGLMQASRQQRA